MRTARSVWLGACLLLVAMGMRGAAAPPPARATTPVSSPPCGVPQSPRDINPAPPLSPYLCQVTGSSVTVSADQSYVDFRARPGMCVNRLFRCGQHYHAPVENVQGCPGETVLMPRSGTTPPVDQWIEVHTLYAPGPRPDVCDSEKLNCCVGHPVLVLAFSAKVASGDLDRDILTPTRGQLAEWSGSDTGGDTNIQDCKPVSAYWSFRLPQQRCVPLPIPQGQLRRKFPRYGAQDARVLQAGQRISKDLVLAPSPP